MHHNTGEYGIDFQNFQATSLHIFYHCETTKHDKIINEPIRKLNNNWDTPYFNKWAMYTEEVSGLFMILYILDFVREKSWQLSNYISTNSFDAHIDIPVFIMSL